MNKTSEDKPKKFIINLRVTLSRELHKKFMIYKANTGTTFIDFVRQKIRELPD